MELIKKIGFREFFLISGFFINPFNYGFLFGYLLILLLLTRLSEIKLFIDVDAILLLIFSTVYALYYLFDPVKGPQFIIIYFLFPTAFYLLGKLISNKIQDYFTLYRVLLTITIIYSLVALASVLLNIYQEGFVTIKRDVPLIWGNTINATGTAAMLFANMCIPALLIFSIKRSKPIEIFLLVSFFFASAVSSLRLGSRTQIGIFLFTFVASLIFMFSKQTALKKIVSFIIIFVGLNILVSYIAIDYESDLFSAYATRMESREYGASTAGGRTQKWAKSFEYIVERPLGWSVEDFGYSHNLWLDTARAGTVIALVFLLLFTLLSFKRIFTLLRKTEIDIVFKNQCLVYYLAFMLQFFVEPIIDGSFELFALFCLFLGIIKRKTELANTVIKTN